MGTFHETDFVPTIKETASGRWYILFELHDKTGIAAVDKGDRQVGIVFPEGTDEADVRAMMRAVRFKGAKLAFIE